MKIAWFVARRRARRAAAAAITSAIAIFVATASVRAEDAYRWEDGSGHVLYGSKPPGGARNVSRLDGKSFSTYSSEKMLKRHGRAALASSAHASENVEHGQTANGSGEDFTVKESDLTPPSIPVPEAQLEASAVNAEIKHGEVSSCSVEVTNRGELPAKGVSVTFRFADGQSKIAHGPGTLQPSQTAIYELSPSELPITLASDAPEGPPVAQVEFKEEK